MTKAQEFMARQIGLAVARARKPKAYFGKVKARKLAKRLGLKGKVDAGIYRVVFIVGKTVYKVTSTTDRDSSLQDEINFINKMARKGKGKFFPKSELVKIGPKTSVMVQEKINGIEGYSVTDSWLHSRVDDLALSLGIDDMHGGNYGWKGKGRDRYPVFVDVDMPIRPIVAKDSSPNDIPRNVRLPWMVSPLCRRDSWGYTESDNPPVCL